MRKPIIPTVLKTLAKQAGSAVADADFHPLTRDRRRELSILVRGNRTAASSVLAAAQTHPDAVGDLVDLKAMQADLDFIAEVEPIVEELAAAVRAVADEVLVRKARSSQSSFALKRMLDASSVAGAYARAAVAAGGPVTDAERVAATADRLKKPARRKKAAKGAKAASPVVPALVPPVPASG